ncbi:phospholipid-binding protein [Massilia sp. Root351]|uniref:YbhB/YbcL family Raf kinase inhibitor-like protein n=1 Tax=Massilia sp. Root351 TaxID=1736522 RepID=UPI00070BAC58|nr:YbhB/YbcL family Raf kinase inhibitor-like protein [Massilia sp. Root351]KQV88600.1 phospholipid-binding protein [Massilia sp. Root351]
MKLWSDSFKNGGRIPAEFAFAEPDPLGRLRLAANRNPHLAWSEVPNGTESLLLLCIDGDAPASAAKVNQEGQTLDAADERADFYHWALADIPPALACIAAGQLADGVVPKGKPGPDTALAVLDGTQHPLRQGINDYTGWFAGDPGMAGDYFGYDGPCPPWNDLRVHHYVFRLYALDVPRLPVDGRFTCVQAYQAMRGHILDEAQIIGAYSLNPQAR